jgi:cytidine deaminase
MPADLVQAAILARDNALAPYSGFKVGAGIETTTGRVFTGCNIENASLGLTVCAERVALWKALSEGERSFARIAVVSDGEQPPTPCGACRQLLWEYCGDIPVTLHSIRGVTHDRTTAQLLPDPFSATHFSTGRSN